LSEAIYRFSYECKLRTGALCSHLLIITTDLQIYDMYDAAKTTSHEYQALEYGMNLLILRDVIFRIKRPTLTLDIPSLARQRCLPSWGPRRTPWFFFCSFSTVWCSRLLKL